VNRVQNLRKEMGLEVLDKIGIEVERDGEVVTAALTEFKDYISLETQALTLELKDTVADASNVDMDEFQLKIKISVKK
jgi:isoleucyl-tRNA synthetase